MSMTLEKLPTATADEVFWNAFDILTSQKAMSFYLDPLNGNKVVCQYRDGKGNRCGAGTAFSDEEYKPKWEGTLWHAIAREDDSVPDEHSGLLNDIQMAHDNWCGLNIDGTLPTPEEWIEVFKYVAQEHGISNFPPVE